METKLSVLHSADEILTAANTSLLFWEESRALFTQVFFSAVHGEMLSFVSTLGIASLIIKGEKKTGFQ